MIVPMKKISIVVRSSWKDDVLMQLSELEVLHLQPVRAPAGEGIDAMKIKIKRLEKASAIIDRLPEAEKKEAVLKEECERDGLDIADELLSLEEETRHAEEEILSLDAERHLTSVWGGVDPEEIESLKKRGLFVRLFKCRRRDLDKIPAGVDAMIVHRGKSTLYLALISTEERIDFAYEEVEPPAHGAEELHRKIEQKKEELSALKERIPSLARYRPLLKKASVHYGGLKEFEEARAGMGGDSDVAYLTGFIPSSEIARIEDAAAKNNWAILIEEPSEEDDCPTLIKHSKLSLLFQPVMNFIGVVPGYREYDTNILFLIFFSIFFAMIVGDGGYGLILLVATFAAAVAFKNIPGALKMLLYLLSLTTVIWGAMTGAWFGVASVGAMPILGDMVVPSLNSFVKENDSNIIHLCFLIAAFHLSIAHLWKGAREYPSLIAVADIGWLMLVWSIYFFAGYLILTRPLPAIALYLPFGGFALIILFSQQKSDGFLKGFIRGILNAPLTLLDGVGSFSHLVSYLRLFAVGLATKEVAVAFNGLAESVGYYSTLSVFGAIMVLLFGHTLNVLLAAMAVLVHAVRLNLLEFSGHMSIQWSGIAYRPFRAGNKSVVKI